MSIPFKQLAQRAIVTTVAALSVSAAAAHDHRDVQVVDPVSGETVALRDVDVRALTEDQRADLGAQLAEQGISPRRRGRNVPDVDVVDPSTGETVSLRDVDVRALTEEEREDLGAQLSDLGIERPDGPGGRGGRDGRGGPRGEDPGDT